MTFYREPNGDYMVVYYENGFRIYKGSPSWDARASGLSGIASSVQGTSVDAAYLLQCEPINRDGVPSEWLNSLDPTE